VAFRLPRIPPVCFFSHPVDRHGPTVTAVTAGGGCGGCCFSGGGGGAVVLDFAIRSRIVAINMSAISLAPYAAMETVTAGPTPTWYATSKMSHIILQTMICRIRTTMDIKKR